MFNFDEKTAKIGKIAVLSATRANLVPELGGGAADLEMLYRVSFSMTVQDLEPSNVVEPTAAIAMRNAQSLAVDGSSNAPSVISKIGLALSYRGKVHLAASVGGSLLIPKQVVSIDRNATIVIGEYPSISFKIAVWVDAEGLAQLANIANLGEQIEAWATYEPSQIDMFEEPKKSIEVEEEEPGEDIPGLE